MFEFLRTLFGIPTAREVELADRKRRRKKMKKHLEDSYFRDTTMDYIIIDEIFSDENNYECDGNNDSWDKIAEDLDIDFGYDCTTTDDTNFDGDFDYE